MRLSPKAMIITAVVALTIPIGAAPALATTGNSGYVPQGTSSAASPAALYQTLQTSSPSEEGLVTGQALTLDSVLADTVATGANIPSNFDVEASIALAQSEIGTSRPTGWNQQGECLMSAQRWILAGGGNWTGSGNPVANYQGATLVDLTNAQPGDIVQYQFIAAPTAWVTGVHTVMITEVNGDGTFTIIESNNPGGSGLVQQQENWTPAPPAGFESAVWRF